MSTDSVGTYGKLSNNTDMYKLLSRSGTFFNSSLSYSPLIYVQSSDSELVSCLGGRNLEYRYIFWQSCSNIQPI